jgi:hypothetical protein
MRVLSESAWKTWSLGFLMIDAIVSPRYVGHSLQRGFNLLRLNAAETIKTTVPHLVTETADTGGEQQIDALRAFAAARHSRQLELASRSRILTPARACSGGRTPREQLGTWYGIVFLELFLMPSLSSAGRTALEMRRTILAKLAREMGLHRRAA